MKPDESDDSRDRGLWVSVAVLGAAALAVAAVFHFRPFAMPGPDKHAAVGTKVPVLEVEPLVPGGQPVRRADLRGQVVLLSFWGPWSDSCRRALPHVAAIAGQYAGRPDFRVLAVACPMRGDEDTDALRSSARAVLAELKAAVPAYVDPTGATLESFRGLAGLELMPTNYLLDRPGTIRFVWPGFREGAEKDIADRIAELLEE